MPTELIKTLDRQRQLLKRCQSFGKLFSFEAATYQNNIEALEATIEIKKMTQSETNLR